MDYTRKDGDDISASIAARAGALLDQYLLLAKELPSTERYDVTLSLSILQLLTSQCVELWKRLEKMHVFKPIMETALSNKLNFGVKLSYVTKNDFFEVVTFGNLTQGIRNCLSHPGNISNGDTGFTSITSGGRISAIRFVHSPMRRNGQARFFRNEVEAQSYITKSKFPPRIRQSLRVTAGERSGWVITKNGQPFYGIFEVLLPVEAIFSLTRYLTRVLAEPSNQNFNGTNLCDVILQKAVA